MANVFIHFEPIGPVGEDIVIEPDLPQYVIRGESSFVLSVAVQHKPKLYNICVS